MIVGLISRKHASESQHEFQDFEEDEAPHMTWRDVYAQGKRTSRRAAGARIASNVVMDAARYIKNAGLTMEYLQQKVAEAYEEGPQVFAMTPRALGVSGASSRLGGMPTMQGLTSFYMRPTLSGYGGSGDVAGLMSHYKAMAEGGSGVPLGWKTWNKGES